MATRQWPAETVVVYGSQTFRLDMRAVERAYLRGVIAGKYDEGRSALAKAAGVSGSTVSRFCHGKAISIRATVAILRDLGLTFDDVATPVDGHAP